MSGILKRPGVQYNSASTPLTAELIREAANAILRKSDEMLADRRPPGPCGCRDCLVSYSTYHRLVEEGGLARCSNCGRGFTIPPPEERE